MPTIVNGGFRSNVLPGSAEATVNIRLLPGARPRPAIRELERVIGDQSVKVDPDQPHGRDRGRDAEALRRARQAAAVEHRHRALPRPRPRGPARSGRRSASTPALFEAGTDAVPWRERGIPVYGVYPYPISRAELADMHGNDERISIRRLEEGTDMLTRVVQSVAAR